MTYFRFRWTYIYLFVYYSNFYEVTKSMLPNKIDNCLVAYSWLIRKYEVIAFLFCLYFGSISGAVPQEKCRINLIEQLQILFLY